MIQLGSAAWLGGPEKTNDGNDTRQAGLADICSRRPGVIRAPGSITQDAVSLQKSYVAAYKSEKKRLSHRRRRNQLQSTSADAKMRNPGLLWLLTALARLLWLLPALPAVALTPGTTASPPPRATQNWWDTALLRTRKAAAARLVRDDGTRLARHARGRAAHSPALGRERGAQFAGRGLVTRWHRDGLCVPQGGTAEPPRRPSSPTTRTGGLQVFAAAGRGRAGSNNLGPLVEWKTFFDLEDGRNRCLLGPICVGGRSAGLGPVPRPLRRTPLCGRGTWTARVAEGVVLIRAENHASLTAHRLGSTRTALGEFASADGRPFVVLALDLAAARAGPWPLPGLWFRQLRKQIGRRGPPRPWSRSGAT